MTCCQKKTRLKAIKSTYEMHILVPKIEQRFQICLVLNQFLVSPQNYFDEFSAVNWIFCASSRIELFNFACKRRGQQKTSLRDPRSKPSSSQTSSYAGIREDANHHPVRRLSKRRWMKKIFTYSFSLMRCLDP